MISHHDLAVIAGSVYRGPWSGVADLDERYALLPRDGELVCAIAGTDPRNALDLIRDARAWPSWIPGLGMMHSGFGKGAAGLWERIDPRMRRDGLITYVGHSLGGAIAENLAAHHALKRPGQPFRAIVFGAPRIAWLNPWPAHLLRRAVKSIEYRNAGDPIPTLPPRALGFLHAAPGDELGAPHGKSLDQHSVALYAAGVAA